MTNDNRMDGTGAGTEPQPLHPNHLPDLRYTLKVLERVHSHGLSLFRQEFHDEIGAAITGMRYVIQRTEQAATASAVMWRYRLTGAPADWNWQTTDHPELARRIAELKDDGGGPVYELQALGLLCGGVPADASILRRRSTDPQEKR